MENKKKFDYGKKLFADPNYKPTPRYNNKDYLKFFKNIYQEVELNTPDEKRAFKQIYNYFKTPNSLISKDVLENLKKIKNKFPEILDPLYDDLYNAFITDITYYRGGSLRAEQLISLLYEPAKIYQHNEEQYELNKAILTKPKFVYEDTGKKHFLSFSRSFDTAFEFAINPFYEKKIINKFIKQNRIPVVIGVNGSDKNLILNPDFSDAVSLFYEDESLYITNKIKLKELYIVNAHNILDYYDKTNIRAGNEYRNNLRNLL